MSVVQMHPNPDLAKRFKEFFRVPRHADPSRLRELYSERIVFRDPAREIRGLVDFEDYFLRLRDDLGDGRFEYLDELALGSTVYIKWKLHFRHPHPGGRSISLRGVSHLQGHNQIEFHEDLYDPGVMHYDQLPRLGKIARWLNLNRAS